MRKVTMVTLDYSRFVLTGYAVNRFTGKTEPTYSNVGRLKVEHALESDFSKGSLVRVVGRDYAEISL